MRRFLFLLLMFMSLAPVSAEDDSLREPFIRNSIFSLDMGYLLTGFRNNGWGLGISYEHLLLDWCSLRGGFSHVTVWPEEYDVTVTTVGFSLDALIYPFRRGFDGPYIGFGSYTDFLMYQGADVDENHKKDTVIHFFPQVGWKKSFNDYFFVDVFYGYRFAVTDESVPEYAEGMTQHGNRFGVKFKFNFPRIFKSR